MPRRRTFAPALQASAHSSPPALRHPWPRLPSGPAPVTRPTPRRIAKRCSAGSFCSCAGRGRGRRTLEESPIAPTALNGPRGCSKAMRGDETFAAPADGPPTGSRPSGVRRSLARAGLGIGRATSPDVRVGHPWPPLSPRRLRFRPPGFACRRGRLPWHSQPLAEAVDDSRAADGPWVAYRHSTRRRWMRRQRRQKTLGVFCRRPRGKGHGWLYLRSSQCGRKV